MSVRLCLAGACYAAAVTAVLAVLSPDAPAAAQTRAAAVQPERPLVWYRACSACVSAVLHWDGVDVARMPDLKKTFARIRRIEALIATAMPAGVEDVLLVGIDQRTPHKAGFRNGSGAASLKLQHTWAADGSLTELVGVRVEPDQPICLTGDVCTVHVHLRLGDKARIDAAAIRLTRIMVDGRERAIALRPDPSASDPTNPFEQSFVGQFLAGAKPGVGRLRAVVQLAGAKPRVVEEMVAVMTR